jgi:hypothetical protein
MQVLLKKIKNGNGKTLFTFVGKESLSSRNNFGIYHGRSLIAVQ